MNIKPIDVTCPWCAALPGAACLKTAEPWPVGAVHGMRGEAAEYEQRLQAAVEHRSRVLLQQR